MGNFGYFNIDAKNLQETVDLAKQKALDEQNRVSTLAQTLNDYRVNQLNSNLPDGQYYVKYDFNTSRVVFQLNTDELTDMSPLLRTFKKGDLVDVVTVSPNSSGALVKAIQIDNDYFYADPNKLSKNKPNDVLTTESLEESKRINENKTVILIIGAFLLGFLITKE